MTRFVSLLIHNYMCAPSPPSEPTKRGTTPSRTNEGRTQATNGIAIRTGSCRAAASSSCLRCCRVTALRRSSNGPTATPSRSLASSASHSANAGLSTPQAFQQLHRYLDEPTRTVFHDCSELLTHGSRFHDVVKQLFTTIGNPAFALCEALLASERDGIAVGPLLERLSAVTRQQRRQELDAAARQLPIRMAIPLVVCVLPSFVLLGVVPLFVGSLGGLGAHM